MCLVLVLFNIWCTAGNASSIIPMQYTTETPAGVRLSFIHDPANSMTVSWWTASGNTDSKVFYGTSPGNLTSNATGTAPVMVPTGFIHNVELAGLSPDTEYFYTCGGASGNSSIFNFTTAPSPRARGMHFAAYGDTRSNQVRRRITADMILQNASIDYGTDAELVLHAGDIVSRGTEQDQFDEFSSDVQPLAAHVPMMYIAGNHEIGGLNSLYPQQFLEPANGNDGWYYSFNWGPVHFVGLDTETHGIPLLDAMDLSWMREDFRRARLDNTVLWIVVWFHQPLFVSFSHDSRVDLRESWGALFDEFKVDLVLGGHCHAYQRNYPVSHDGTISTAGTPNYVNPPYPMHVVAGAGAVNSDSETNASLRDDNFIARSNDTIFDAFGNRTFFPSNSFVNVNVTVDELTNTTRLWAEVYGLRNFKNNPTETNYTSGKIDAFSITKDIPETWYQPANNITYPGKTLPGVHNVILLIATIGIITIVDLLVIVSWRKSKKHVA